MTEDAEERTRASRGENAPRAAARIDGHEAGLTLVEMIVALALAALVVAFLAQGTGLLRHFADLGRAVSAQDETLAIRDHLRRTVEGTMGHAGSSQQDYFAGVADTVVFTVPGDRLLERAGPVRITLTAVAEPGGMSLVETRAPAGTAGHKGLTRRLINGATRVRFAFFGAMGGEGPAWLPEWTDPGSSPTLMRIDVVFPAGDVRRWPAFVVLMPTGGSAGASPKPPADAGAGRPAKAG